MKRKPSLLRKKSPAGPSGKNTANPSRREGFYVLFLEEAAGVIFLSSWESSSIDDLEPLTQGRISEFLSHLGKNSSSSFWEKYIQLFQNRGPRWVLWFLLKQLLDWFSCAAGRFLQQTTWRQGRRPIFSSSFSEGMEGFFSSRSFPYNLASPKTIPFLSYTPLHPWFVCLSTFCA